MEASSSPLPNEVPCRLYVTIIDFIPESKFDANPISFSAAPLLPDKVHIPPVRSSVPGPGGGGVGVGVGVGALVGVGVGVGVGSAVGEGVGVTDTVGVGVGVGPAVGVGVGVTEGDPVLISISRIFAYQDMAPLVLTCPTTRTPNTPAGRDPLNVYIFPDDAGLS